MTRKKLMSEKVVIIGQRGSGKTLRLCKWILEQVENGCQDIAVLGHTFRSFDAIVTPFFLTLCREASIHRNTKIIYIGEAKIRVTPRYSRGLYHGKFDAIAIDGYYPEFSKTIVNEAPRVAMTMNVDAGNIEIDANAFQAGTQIIILLEKETIHA